MKIVSQLAERLKSLGTNVELPKGTALFAQGEPAKGVFLLNAGRAYVSLLTMMAKRSGAESSALAQSWVYPHLWAASHMA